MFVIIHFFPINEKKMIEKKLNIIAKKESFDTPHSFIFRFNCLSLHHFLDAIIFWFSFSTRHRVVGRIRVQQNE